MFTILKNIIFCNLILLCVISGYSQNSSTDYIPSQLISYGIDAPGRMAIDSNDYTYVIDADKNSIIIYDGSGVYKRQIITDFHPISIAVNKRGQLFVGDDVTGNIYNINYDGRKSLFYTGTKLPNSMAFGFKNILYVTDSEAKEVLGLDVSGKTVLQFSDPNFTFPTGIAFDEKNNWLVVSEHGGIGPETDTYCNQNGGWSVRNYGPNTSIYTFDLNGTLLNQFGCFGVLDGQNHRIQGIAVGPCGNIYAVDPYLGRISVYDEFGNFLTHVGQWGYGSGEFDLPIDLLFSSDNRLIVSSMDKASLDIFEITLPTPSARFKSADITTCSGLSELEVQFTGTAPWTFTYTIDGLNPTEITTSDNPYALMASAGWYEITALTDGNLATATCFTGGAMVTTGEQPTASVSSSSLNKCTNDGAGIDISFTGIPPYKFTYTIDNKNPIEVTTTENVYILIPEKSGVYEITSISDDGCSGTVNNGIVDVVVNPLPTAEITNGNGRITIPEGGTTELTVAFTGTGPWTFIYEIDEKNPVTITTDQNPYMLTTSLEGTYEVVHVTDAYCSSNVSKGYPEVVFGNTAEPAVATIQTITLTFCEGDTVSIPISFTGMAPWTFIYTIDGVPAGQITTSEGNYILMSSIPGVYELSALIDGLNIPGTFSGSAEIIENPLPILDLGPDIYICEGDQSYLLDAGLFESYLWSDGSTGRTLEVSAPGLYGVTVTNVYGCSTSDFVNVSISTLPDAYFYYDINALEVQFVNKSLNTNIHYWDFGDGTSSTDENPIHSYASRGTYTVTYTASSNYCGNSTFTETLSVSDKSTSEIIDIYPNPSTGKFTIAISPNEPITGSISVFINSTSGQFLYSGTYNSNIVTSYNGKYYIDINIDHFTKGIYIVYVNAGNFVGQDKLILKD